MSNSELHSGYDSKPIPDPTVLTTQQLFREIGHLRTLVETRMDAMDKAVLLLQDFANRSPTIAEIGAKYDQQFASVQLQFTERNMRFERIDIDNKRALDAALESSHQAASKAEMAFTKQFDQLNVMINKQGELTNERIDEIRSRVTLNEGRNRGIGDSWGVVVGTIGIIATTATIIGFIVFHQGPNTQPVVVPFPTTQVK